MENPAEIIRSFYERLGAGGVAGALDLIALNIVRFRQYIDTFAVEEARS